MRRFLLFLTACALSVSAMFAQATVSGTVTDADSGEPLEGVAVLIKGTTVGMFTDANGKYSLQVPEDASTLLFTFVGKETVEELISGRSTINVGMVPDDLVVDEVVVTALGIAKEKKALGYGVSTISSGLVEKRGEADISRILRGKAAGVDITTTSGMAGTGTNVIIRGYSSITGNNQPLFVVDGIPFNTETNNDRNFVTGGATASSRFLDLDPNNIVEVNILKGLSATVLYGEAGRNGVVLITTKNGSAGTNAKKGFEVTFNQNIMATEVANLPDYQNTYGNGFSGNFGWFFSNWGPSFDVRGSNGIDENGQVDHPLDQAQYNDAFPEFIGQRYDYRPYESVEGFFQRGLATNTSISVDKNLGANSAVNFNYSFLRDNGFVPNNANVFSKHNFGLGGSTKLENGLSIRTTFNYVDSDRTVPPASVGFGSNPSGASLFSNVLYTPRSIDLLNLPYQNPLDGSQVYYRRGSAIQNPLWTLDNASDTEQIRRFFGAINLNYDITDWLSVFYRFSIDQYSQNQRRGINKGGSQVPNGQLSSSSRLNRISDQVLNLNYAFNLSDDLVLDGLVGLNTRFEERDQTVTTSEQQFVFGLLNHGNFVQHNNFSFITQENNIGAYLTASLAYRDFLYVNFQGRNDWTSTLEQANRSVFYPSASVAFVPTDAFAGLRGNKYVNYLKLRVGYGTSAGYPDPYGTRSVLDTRTNQYVADDGTILNINSVSDFLGNPNLAPELHSEAEVGIEARFVDNRIGIDLSLYDKSSRDLIIDLRLDPATGFDLTRVNAASIRNRGIELGMNFVPFRGKFTWSLDWNFTRNVNTVESIADGVDQVPIAGYTNLGNFAIPGEWYGIMQGIPWTRDEAGDLLVGEDGNYIASQDIGVIGNPNPQFTTNILSSMSFAGFSFNMQWSYQHRGDIYSITTATMLARGNTVDTDFDRFLPVILPGTRATTEAENNIQGYAGDFFFNAYFFADEGAVFDATNLRMREISLSYSVPKSIMEKLPIGSLSISLIGENMWFRAFNFPEGVNFDPEVLSLGVGNGRGFDFLTGPTARRYGGNISLTF